MAKKKAPAATREVKHPHLTVNGVRIPEEKCVVSREENLELLGWEAAPQPGAFGEDYFLIDEMGRQVRLLNNLGNRPYRPGDMKLRMQDFLNGRWELNGETAIVGEYGDVLSLQHRGVAFELAWQRWEGWLDGERSEERAADWKRRLPDGPVFRTLVVRGVKQTPKVIQTIDSVTPRTDVDVIYTSGLFNDMAGKPRLAASRALGYAVRLVWHRAGQDANAYAPYRTNSEVMDFVRRHPRLVDAVRHVVEEDGAEGRVALWLRPGTAAGLLYLMGCRESDGDAYRAKLLPDEEGLAWKSWGRAKEFWGLVAAGPKAEDKALAAMYKARRPVEGEPRDPKAPDGLTRSGLVFGSDDQKGGDEAEKVAVIVRAWNEFAEGARVSPGTVKLEYDVREWNDDDTLALAVLVDHPRIGGIDLTPKLDREEEAAERTAAETAAERAEMAAEKAAEVPAGPGAVERAYIAGVRTQHPGVVLLFKGKTTFGLYEEDAEQCAPLLGVRRYKDGATGIVKAQFDHEHLEGCLEKLHAAGLKVARVAPAYNAEGKEIGQDVTMLQPRPARPAAPKPLGRTTPAPAPAPARQPAPPSAKGKMGRKAPVPLRGGTNS